MRQNSGVNGLDFFAAIMAGGLRSHVETTGYDPDAVPADKQARGKPRGTADNDGGRARRRRQQCHKNLGGTGLLKMLGTAVNLASGQAKRPSIREIPV